MSDTATVPEEGKIEFMTLLRRHRLAKGLTQTELARKLGTVPSSVSMWESGQTLPHASMFPKLARLLDIDPMALTKLIDPAPAPNPGEGAA
jgi:transcriptional regulator with XRE-family HTH domain